MNYKTELDFMVETAVEAGKAIMGIYDDYHRRRAEIGITPKGVKDFRTAADRKSEEIIKERLLRRFPDFNFYGEETEREDKGSEHTWVVDPIDGTTYLSLRIPYFSESIGLVKRSGESVAGVIFNPATEELYAAARNGGAFYRNLHIGEEHRMKVLGEVELKESLTFINTSVDVEESKRIGIELFRESFETFKMPVLNYSSALDMTRIADGLIPCGVFVSTAPYDHAAGSLLVEEAGGFVTNIDGSRPFNVFTRGIIACNTERTFRELQEKGYFRHLRQL